MSAGQHNRYFVSGIEAPMGKAMVGTAMGYAECDQLMRAPTSRSRR